MRGPSYFGFDLVRAATLSMTSPDADPAYAVQNAQNDDPADTARANGTSTLVTVTLDAVYQVVAAMVANTNATSISVASVAGLSQAITVPTRTGDGQIINGWKNLTGIANNTDNDWTVSLSKTGTAKLEFGRIVLVAALIDVEWRWGNGNGPKFGIRRPGYVENVTRLGTKHRRPGGTQYRVAAGEVLRTSALANHLLRDAHGSGLDEGFFFVPYAEENQAWFAVPRDPTGTEWQSLAAPATSFAVEIDELCMGAPPALT